MHSVVSGLCSSKQPSAIAFVDKFTRESEVSGPVPQQRTVSICEPDQVEVERFPYPYQGAFTVASDIDSASILRFRAIHAPCPRLRCR